MRQSLAANRASVNAHPAAIAKLLEKKKEYDAVSALERASALYLQRIDGLAEDLDVMADAGQVHGQVLEQWPRMFQILSLFCEPYFVRSDLWFKLVQVSARSHEQDDPLVTEGERLVRIPVEELQQTSGKL